MATSLLLSPLSSSAIENRELSCGVGLQNSSFVHSTKRIFSPPSPSARRNGGRRWCFRSPVAAKSFDHIPKRFREENLKDGLMENYKNVPQSLYGLTPRQMDMFRTDNNPIQRQSETVTEESISARLSYRNHSGMYTASSMNEKVPSIYGMSMSMSAGGRGGYGRPRTAPPDLPSLLVDNRIIYLGMPIVRPVTELLIAQFMWLDYDSDKPIYLYINSPGTQNEKREVVGSEGDAYAIADLFHRTRAKVYTINIGEASGQAAMLLSLGEKGYRALQPNAFTKFYLPKLPRSSGPSIDMWITAKELDTNTESYLDLLVEGIGKPKDVIAKDIARGLFLRPQDAIDYGAADRIVYSLDEYDRKDYVEMAAQNKAMRKGAAASVPFPWSANS